MFRLLFMKVSRYISSACMLLVLVGFVAYVHAQEGTKPGEQTVSGSSRGGVLEEVVVTARKKAESLQTVPISVSAFTSADLELRSIDTIQDLSRFAPNLIVNSAGSAINDGATYIRGVGEKDQNVTLDPAVGVYIDGVYLGRISGNILDLIDVERIEVLRGPQGTLFGRNAIGGAINIVSVAPDTDRSADISVTYGNDELLDINATFNLPLVEDKLFMRGSVSRISRDCLGRLVSSGDCIGGKDSVSARGVVRWLPTDSLTIDLTTDVTDGDDTNAPYALLAVNPNAFLAVIHNSMVTSGALGPNAVLYDSNLPALNGDPYETDGTFSTEAPLNVNGYSARFNWQINDDMNLIGISAYRETEVAFSFDGDASTADIAGLDSVVETDQFSQELRLEGSSMNDRLDWVIGVYYFEESADFVQDLYIPFIGLEQGNAVVQDSKSYAAFGHFSYDLSERLRLSGGLRYTHDKKDASVGISNLLTDSAGVFSVLPLTNAKDSWGSFSPKIALDYQVNDRTLLYGSISRGIRSGGINGRAQTPDAVNTYDAEFVTSYEIGLKSQYLDNRLRLNAAGYYSDYSDRQVSIVRILPSGAIVNLIDNAAAARIFGFELEMKGLVGPRLSLEGSLGYTNAEFTDIEPGSGITEDSAYIFTPKWTGAAGAEYSMPIGGSVLTARVDYSYRSDIEFLPASTPFTGEDDVGLWNTRMVYEPADQNWKVTLWGRNLSDNIYITQSLDFTGFTGYAGGGFSVGREYGVTFTTGF